VFWRGSSLNRSSRALSVARFQREMRLVGFDIPVAHGFLEALLKELQARTKALEASNAALEVRIAALEISMRGIRA
jgi:hypothetical protein